MDMQISKSLRAGILFPVVSLVLSACGGTEPETNGPLMRATIDGFAWKAVDLIAEPTGEAFVIEGVSSIGSRIRLRLVDVDTIGVYPLGVKIHEASFSDEGIDRVAFGFGAGTVIVTELTDERIAGTFGFTARDTIDDQPDVAVTNGRFDVER